MKSNFIKSLLFVLFVFYFDEVLAQDFGKDGKALINIGWASDQLSEVTIQDDGKIIAAGQTYVGTRYFTLVRYSEDGHIDSTFGVDGIVKTDIGPSNDYLNSIDIDKSTGKIIVTGYSQKYDGTNDFFATVKYLKSGVIDSSFGTYGILVNKIGTFGAQATTVKIQNNSNILVGGSSSLGATLLMLKPNGKIDSTFGKDGIFGYVHRGTYTSVNSILIDQNDRIIIAANYSSTAIIMRLQSNGTFDNSWSADGREELNLSGVRVEGMAFTKNNEIIATGDNYNTFKFFALKLNENGVVDKSFGTDGLAILSLPAHLLYVSRNCGIQQNGNIVISGYYASGSANNTNIVVGRLTSDGFPDTTFSKYGIIELFFEDNTGRATTMLIDKNDKILIGGADEENHGQDDFLLIRLESSGKRDSLFRSSGVVVTGIGSSSDYLRGAYLQSNNKIIISGVSEDDAAIVRLLPTGELDYKFSSDGITTLAICGVDATSDITETINNKILFLGSKCTGSGIYRLLENGILDSTFGISGSIINPLGLNSRIFRLKNDNFRIINGNKVAEYLVNGDLNFNYGIGGFSSADIPDQFFTKYSTMLSDGSFITGGSKTNGEVIIYKIDPKGALDDSFGNTGRIVFPFSGSTGQSVRGIVEHNDGKIFITGYQGSLLYIIKLFSNGDVDSTFGINGILNFKDCIGCRVIRIGLLSNNKIILAGTHDSKYFFLYQLNPDGSPELKFGPNGKFEIGFNNQLSDLTEMIIEKNDQIFLAGTSNRDFAIVKILPSLILGVIDKSVKEKIINIYPNPVHNDLFSIDYELSFDQVISIALYQTNGQLVKLLINGEKRFSGKQLEQFEFPKGFTNGTYILEIKSKEGMSSKTLILMNNF